jgi:hypothetical protein
MDLLDIKGRIAVALVESIFRRAGFALSPAIGALAASGRQGREDLTPDFAAARPAEDPAEPPSPPRAVEVRYRPQVAQYLAIETQRAAQSVFALAKRRWPGLVFVFVTDHPEAGRSCFQAVDLAPWHLGVALTATDLYAHEGLAIYRQNVEEHEALLRRMFALLTGSA